MLTYSQFSIFCFAMLVMRYLAILVHTNSCRYLSPGYSHDYFTTNNEPAHTSLLVRNFLADNNTVFSILGLLRLSPVSKTEETHERTGICYDWGDRNCIAGRAQDYIKNCLSIYFEDSKKRWHKYIKSEGDYFEEAT